MVPRRQGAGEDASGASTPAASGRAQERSEPVRLLEDEDAAAPAGATDEQILRALMDEASASQLEAPERSRLLRSAAGGDREAEGRVVRSQYATLVRLAAGRRGGPLGVPELVQEGTIGLIGAVRQFDASGAEDFDAYVVARIEAEMDAALKLEEAAAREARQAVQDAESFERVELQLASELKRRPTGGEIAARLEWTGERTAAVGEMVAYARRLHDEELLQYVDPGSVDVYDLIEPGDAPDRN